VSKEKQMEDSTLTEQDILYPMAYVVYPERIGRYKEIGQFEIIIQESPRPLALEVARAIRKEAGRYLISKEYDVWVDMERGLFEIDRGRFGRGSFRLAEEGAE
jgi:hypothetical protein